MEKLKSLHYPGKIYLIIVLCVATLISLLSVYTIQSASGNRPYLFIFWDTFLAWVPVGIAVMLDLIFSYTRKKTRALISIVVGASWLFFYPNAPYLVTDLLHVFARYSFDPTKRFWADVDFWQHLFTIFTIAMIGLLLGAYSLFSVQHLVRVSYGAVASWSFAIFVLLLSSFGIYIGRFIRWNSWDVIMRPGYILKELVIMLTDRSKLYHIFTFCKFMFMVLIISYVLIYVITRVRKL
ncbi:DUF1361 domain-containing protein [Paenibacillus qinlingensis]|uniref:DUF1361 domain-containing protein n=1 Tax=Paenibacillus qinlingensis TaxID=1837343 RepID=UPI0015653809|nr:DUF1361 domain-containing protein [Paenibacillus qinlingensis]NQX58124.1 DUF1361 domain-containing protein [Paenibacillus qinlingensis]